MSQFLHLLIGEQKAVPFRMVVRIEWDNTGKAAESQEPCAGSCSGAEVPFTFLQCICQRGPSFFILIAVTSYFDYSQKNSRTFEPSYVCIMDVSVYVRCMYHSCVCVLWMYLCMMHVSFMCVYIDEACRQGHM